METQKIYEVLRNAEETLRTAEHGLNDLKNAPPERRLAGLRNAVVFGRAVTNVLENLRRIEPAFDSWYGPVSQSLKSDSLMKYFYKLRTMILKQGRLSTAVSVSINNLQLPKDIARFGPPPRNNCGFFIGDSTGGMGWVIKLPDGSTEKLYIEMPADIGTIDTLLTDAPVKPEENSAYDLTSRYLEKMRAILLQAKNKFQNAG